MCSRPRKARTRPWWSFWTRGLAHLADVVERCTGRDIRQLHGAGAAGGMGGGMVAFFGSTLQMGIETVLDTVGFDKLLEGADMVFSGEGKLDAQSLLGKVVIGVARRAKRAGVPLVAVVGDIGDNIEAAYDMGVSAVFSINRVAVPFREAKPRSKSDLALTMDNLMRFCRRMGSVASRSHPRGPAAVVSFCDETSKPAFSGPSGPRRRVCRFIP